jgi:hypothetical protein
MQWFNYNAQPISPRPAATAHPSATRSPTTPPLGAALVLLLAAALAAWLDWLGLVVADAVTLPVPVADAEPVLAPVGGTTVLNGVIGVALCRVSG